jgi:acid stress-induced BolA-like protein IbaG/YrbA
MAYYFQCNKCKKKETFRKNLPNEKIHEGKKQEYEVVLCSNCFSKLVRVKCNYIII